MPATSVPEMAVEPLPQEFEDVFEAHWVQVYRTTYGVTGRVEDAEDVVQTVFLRLLKRDRQPDFLKNPKGYLYRAAVNQSLTIVQRRRRCAVSEASEELAHSVPSRASSRAEDVHRKIFTALEEDLGLKIEPARTSREYIVIDHVERPVPN